MKRPEIEKCPCCETKIRIAEDVATITAWTVEASSNCVNDENGEMLYCILTWRCKVCGCSWKHGQFTEKQKESNGKTD